MALWQVLAWPLAAVGVATLALGAMLAQPVKSPPPLESIDGGAMAIPQDGKPELSRFQARDGTWLAYRLYPAADGGRDHLAIVYHGSSASSDAMNATALALAKANFVAVAVDTRGHGASGSRGDIACIGQLEGDLADLIAHLRADYATARLTLVGHSAGGGFVLRAAAAPVGASFDRFVLLAPYLGYRAPTNRPSEGKGLWAAPDIPRIIALTILGRIGVDWAQSLPAIAFANRPEAAMATTSRYSYRLLIDYGPPQDWQGALQGAASRIELIAGENDELMDAPAYQSAVAPLGVRVTLLPSVDHMGVVYQPAALEAIVQAAQR
ncbi:MAG: alpha/beta fold hydrolase [Roseiarcus sp.]|jgi:alpha-beta hydrolase superfamily lysophospholipase